MQVSREGTCPVGRGSRRVEQKNDGQMVPALGRCVRDAGDMQKIPSYTNRLDVKALEFTPSFNVSAAIQIQIGRFSPGFASIGSRPFHALLCKSTMSLAISNESLPEKCSSTGAAFGSSFNETSNVTSRYPGSLHTSRTSPDIALPRRALAQVSGDYPGSSSQSFVASVPGRPGSIGGPRPMGGYRAAKH